MADTFDAGTVYAESRLGRDQFKRDMRELIRDMQQIERRALKVRVQLNGIDQAKAQAESLRRSIQRDATMRVKLDLTQARRDLTEFRRGVAAAAKMKIEINTTRARADMTAFRKWAERPITIKVRLDLTQARRQLAQFRAQARDLEMRVKIDTTTIITQLNQVHSVSNRINLGDGLNSRLKSATSSAMSLRTILIGVAAAAALASAPGLVSIIGALVQAGGALLTLPAIVAAAAVAFGTLKMGMQGFGEAMKNLGDPEKFAEAIAKLSPAAREAALAVRELHPEFKALQQSVQDRLFTGMAEEIRTLGSTYLPILTTGFQGSASAINQMVREMTGMLAQGPAVNDVTNIFAGTNGMLGNMKTSLADVVSGLLGVAGVGSEYLPRMGTAISNVAGEFRAWVDAGVESGRINEIIDQGIEQAKMFGQVLGNLGAILGDVWTAGETAGGGFLLTLRNLTDQVRAFTGSTEGQTALVGFFTALNQVAAAVAPIFLELARIIGTTLMPVIGMIAQALGPSLLTVVKALGQGVAVLAPQLVPLAAAFGQILVALSPLLPLVGEIAGLLAQVLTGALKALTPAITVVVKALSDSLTPIMPVLAKALGDVLKAVTPLITMLGDGLAQVITLLAPVIAELATMLSEYLVFALGQLQPMMPVLIDAMMKVLEAVLPLVPVLAEMGIQVMTALLPAIIQLLPPLAELLVALTPLLPPLIELTASLMPIMVELINIGLVPALELLAGIISNVVVPIVDLLVIVINGLVWILNQVTDATAWLLSKMEAAWPLISSAVTGAWELIRPALTPLKELIGHIGSGMEWLWKELFVPGWKAISGAVTGMWEIVRDPLEKLWDILKKVGGAFETVKDIVDWIPSIPGLGGNDYKGSPPQQPLPPGMGQTPRGPAGTPGTLPPYLQALGGILKPMAQGGVLGSMSPVAQVVPPNTWRVIGDRMQGDEAYIPLDGSARSMAILQQAAAAMGVGITPMAQGGILGAITGSKDGDVDGLKKSVQDLAKDALGPLAAEVTARTVPSMTTMRDTFPQVAQQALGLAAAVTQSQIQQSTDFATLKTNVDVSTAGMRMAVDGLRDGSNAAWAAMRATTDAEVATITGPILGGLNTALGTARSQAAMTGSAWETELARIRAAAADPIRWTMQFPLGPEGLAKSWNTLNDQFALGKPLTMPVPKFATGGLIRGPGTGKSDDIPIMASDHEFMVNSATTKRVLPFLKALNDNQPEALQAAGIGNRMPGYATGGLIEASRVANQAIGKPYVWGATGPNSFDCSGLWGAIVNAAVGAPVYGNRRFTTSSFGSGGAGGLIPGASSALTVGVQTGHMAGTLSGGAFEATPPRVLGPGAAKGAMAFPRQYSLPQVGGQFVPEGPGGGGGFFDPGPMVDQAFAHTYGLVDEITKRWTSTHAQGVQGVARRATDAARDAAKGMLASSMAAPVGGGGGGVERWRPMVLRALGIAGQPASYADLTLRRMNQESGGDPNIVNNWDSNAAKGTPSVGLMQVIGPTYRAYKHPQFDVGPYVHGTSVDPMANTLASMRYALNRYGSLPAAYNRPGGYKQGGWMFPGQVGFNETRNPEMVLTERQWDLLPKKFEADEDKFVAALSSAVVDALGSDSGRALIGNVSMQLPEGTGARAMLRELMTEVWAADDSGPYNN